MPGPGSAKTPEQSRQVRTSPPGGQSHLDGMEQRPAPAVGAGNKVACSLLEVLKMQMYRNFRPSPSLLLLGAEESSLNTARPGEEC